MEANVYVYYVLTILYCISPNSSKVSKIFREYKKRSTENEGGISILNCIQGSMVILGEPSLFYFIKENIQMIETAQAQHDSFFFNNRDAKK